MNWKTWVPLVLAIVLGLVAMKVAKDFIAKRPRNDMSAGNFIQVVVVKENLMPGAQLKPENLTLAQMSGEIGSDAVFRNIADVEGRVIHAPLFKGQPVVETLLTPKGTGSGLQALVPEGKRAITVEINEFSGVAGFVIPGCRVDVVATVGGEGGDTVSRTIVQNVLVTAVGQRQHVEGSDNEKVEQVKSVTLIVTPKESEAIELAAATGRPRLVLRNNIDKDMPASEGVSVAELRGKARRPVDPFVPIDFIRPLPTFSPTTQPENQGYTPRRTVRVIRGGVETDVTMELQQSRVPKWMTSNPTEPAIKD